MSYNDIIAPSDFNAKIEIFRRSIGHKIHSLSHNSPVVVEASKAIMEKVICDLKLLYNTDCPSISILKNNITQDDYVYNLYFSIPQRITIGISLSNNSTFLFYKVIDNRYLTEGLEIIENIDNILTSMCNV